MKNRFLIGEMSKLHNTPVKTLRYYDEIGLLTPAEIDERNGYRYYSTEQFEQLNTINYLKALGLSLKDIKAQLKKRDFDEFLDVLKKEKAATEHKLKELEVIRGRFENRIRELEQARAIQELEVVLVKELPARQILRLKETISSEPELELSLRKLENVSERISSIFIGGVGLTVSRENLLRFKFEEYNSIFILLEEEHIHNGWVTTLPAGRYICMYYRGNHQESVPYYHMLLAYCQEHGMQIGGDSIERTIIDQFISSRPEDYLTEIQIPIMV